ncbi:MAG: helix-turn-helix domain-containing protein [Burkholderiales bacterium]
MPPSPNRSGSRPRPRPGTQAIERAVRVLTEVTARSRFGWRPTDLAARCGLDRGTTHRILGCLARERLVHRRAQDGHYVPGPLLFELALALPAYDELREACAPILARVARRSRGYALFSVRSFDDAVCVASAGTPAYLGTAFDVGTRRPLVTIAAGVAILIALPRAEARGIVDRGLVTQPDRTPLTRMWRRSLALGFAANVGYTARGVNAVAVPLRDPDGTPFGSLAVAAAAAELPAPRLAETAATLADDARRIERLARQVLPEGAYNAPRPS